MWWKALWASRMKRSSRLVLSDVLELGKDGVLRYVLAFDSTECLEAGHFSRRRVEQAHAYCVRNIVREHEMKDPFRLRRGVKPSLQ